MQSVRAEQDEQAWAAYRHLGGHMGSRCVFVAGATGYLGRPLVRQLIARGHRVRALVRAGSEGKLPSGCEPVIGSALDASSYMHLVTPADCFVQLVGVPKPAPWKGKHFRAVDLVAGRAGVRSAAEARVNHFVYVSVAHPAPVMKSYIEVRAEVERMIEKSGIAATILQPWYVLGPGHWWPYALFPLYKTLEALPATRASARRLGLVTHAEMVAALTYAVENPAPGLVRIEVPEIRAIAASVAKVAVRAA